MAYRLGERAWFEAYDAGKQLSAETAMDLAELAVSPAPRHDAARAAVGCEATFQPRGGRPVQSAPYPGRAQLRQ
jgi:hypothetical protein